MHLASANVGRSTKTVGEGLLQDNGDKHLENI